MPKTSLASFASGKVVSAQGCMFGMLNDETNEGRVLGFADGPPGLPMDVEKKAAALGYPKDICGRFRVRIMQKLMPQAKACANYITYQNIPYGRADLFVSSNLRQVRCLVSLSPRWLEPVSQPGMKRRNELSLGEEAYLHLESNRAFDCMGYGRPVIYKHKLLPEADANSDTYSLFNDPPAWQKHYFIKTPGFVSTCWGGHRVIDEPGNIDSNDVGLYLNDGTALLTGRISVLRIRSKDGSTDAPKNLVKVFSPAYVKQVLESKQKRCEYDELDAGDCNLAVEAGYLGGEVNYEKGWLNYARFVVKGVDEVMQQIFNNAK